MNDLESVLPESLQFEDPKRALLSTRRTVSVKPTSGNQVTAASSQDIVSFRLPNSGVLASCYLRGTITPGAITAGSAVTNSFACQSAVRDPYSAGSSWIRKMVVKASDGTELTSCNNYHRYCSVVNRFSKGIEYTKNQGSILDGGSHDDGSDQLNAGFNALVIDQTPTGDIAAGALGITAHAGAYASKCRLAGGGTAKFAHEFQTGILAADKNIMLPLALMGSGMTLELSCADVGEVYRVSPNDTAVAQTAGLTGSLLDIHPATGASIAPYNLTDLELVCDLVFYPPEIMAELSSKMCRGLKIVCDNVRNQINAVTQTENTIILSTHARSVKAILAGVKNSSDSSSVRRDEGEYYKQSGVGDGSVDEIQFSVGSEQVPANPLKFGAPTYMELQKAFKGIISEDFKMGNQVSVKEYNKVYRADTASAGGGGAGAFLGSALWGVNLQSHPEMPDVLSGKSASAGSIAMSMDIKFDATPNANSQCETWVVSDQVVELLADGSALVSR